MKKEQPDFIFNPIKSRIGGSESTSIKLIVNTYSGKAEMEIRHEIYKKYPVQEYSKAMQVYKGLTDGLGYGRRVYDLEEIAYEELENVKRKTK